MDASSVRRASMQALSLALNIIDHSVENQDLGLSLTLSFSKGACLSRIASNEFAKYSSANSTSGISQVRYKILSARSL